ncbi:hypothetical protein Dimus_024314, partial [Dionaea muscipula]
VYALLSFCFHLYDGGKRVLLAAAVALLLILWIVADCAAAFGQGWGACLYFLWKMMCNYWFFLARGFVFCFA